MASHAWLAIPFLFYIFVGWGHASTGLEVSPCPTGCPIPDTSKRERDAACMIKLNNIVVRFGDFTALHDINVHVKEGEFFTFLRSEERRVGKECAP